MQLLSNCFASPIKALVNTNLSMFLYTVFKPESFNQLLNCDEVKCFILNSV